ncbi:MAG: FliM/FliN family flagellar motor switch protein, partial [Aquisalinus sp.]|nr:FliM/FliN family flagellar motor switch protein [Aquisalinus sp.]
NGILLMGSETHFVLRKKLDGKSASSNGVRNMSSLWGGLKNETLKIIGDALGEDIASASPAMGKLSHQKFVAQFNKTTTFYHLGNSLDVFAGLIFFSPPLVSRLAARKLSSDSEETPENTEPGLLDLYLLQPLVQQLIDALRTIYSRINDPEISSDFMLRDQALSLEELNDIDEEADLFYYSLSLYNNKENPPLIGFCFPYAVLEKISLLDNNRVSNIDFDSDDPWSGHMRSTVLQSRLALSIVLDSCQMSVGDCSRLEKGQVLSLPGVSLDDLAVKAQTRSGKVDIARSELGIFKRNKAIKLHGDLDEEFLMNLGRLAAN